MAGTCPTCKVVNIKTGEVTVINESDFDSSVYTRVSKGAGASAPAPKPKAKRVPRKTRGK